MITWIRRNYRLELVEWSNAIKNPVFRGRAKSILRQGQLSRMRLWLTVWTLIFIALAIVYVVQEYLTTTQLLNAGISANYVNTLTNKMLTTAVGVFALSLFYSAAADFYTLLTTAIHSTFSQKDENWDQLALTGIDMETVVDADFQIAQIRAWRVVAPEIACRIAVTTVIANAIVIGLLDSGIDRGTGMFLPLVALQLILMILAGGVIILEPYWRMRMVISFGLRIAAQSQRFVTSLIVIRCLFELLICRFLQFFFVLITLVGALIFQIVSGSVLALMFSVMSNLNYVDLSSVLFFGSIIFLGMVVSKRIYQFNLVQCMYGAVSELTAWPDTMPQYPPPDSMQSRRQVPGCGEIKGQQPAALNDTGVQ